MMAVVVVVMMVVVVVVVVAGGGAIGEDGEAYGRGDDYLDLRLHNRTRVSKYIYIVGVGDNRIEICRILSDFRQPIFD